MPLLSYQVEDDAHVDAGCSGMGSADCAKFALELWVQMGLARGLTVFPLPSDWLQTGILLLAVGIISRSPSSFLPQSEAWLMPKLLQDMHLGMVERLAEILRRRADVMFLTHPA